MTASLAAEIVQDCPEEEPKIPETILVVDDSAAQRKIISKMLSKLNYCVLEAEGGEEALQICKTTEIGIILSDWMMPGMSGIEFCAAFKALEDRPYSYFILLTSKSEKLEVARGLDIGADDFVSKPVSSSELLARIRAGERILDMERELRKKNKLISETLSEISQLYEALDRDLVEARSLQHSLIPERHVKMDRASVSLLLQSSGHVGGDLVGIVHSTETELGLFALDVSGHGVASALLTTRLAGMFLAGDPSQNVALEHSEDGKVQMMCPSVAAKRINQLFMTDIQVEQYFTMVLARIDLTTGHTRLVQCGHPSPLIQSVDGSVRPIGGGGFPIGLIDGAEWDAVDFEIEPGGRMLLSSDGMTEAEDANGNMLEEEGLAHHLEKNHSLKGPALLEALTWDLTLFSGDEEFADDVSGVLFEYHG